MRFMPPRIHYSQVIYNRIRGISIPLRRAGVGTPVAISSNIPASAFF